MSLIGYVPQGDYGPGFKLIDDGDFCLASMDAMDAGMIRQVADNLTTAYFCEEDTKRGFCHAGCPARHAEHEVYVHSPCIGVTDCHHLHLRWTVEEVIEE